MPTDRLVSRTVDTEETRILLDCQIETTVLARMLKNAVLFAGPSDITETGLDGVRLEVGADELAMFASDRYVLAKETTPLSPPDPAATTQAGAVTLSTADAKTLIRVLPRHRWAAAALTVIETRRTRLRTEPGVPGTPAHDASALRTLTARIHRRGGEEVFTLEFTEPDEPATARLPDYYQQKRREHRPGETRSVTFGHRRISKFGRVRAQEPDAAMKLVHATAPDQPVIVRIGNRFEALIVPARPPRPPARQQRPRPAPRPPQVSAASAWPNQPLRTPPKRGAPSPRGTTPSLRPGTGSATRSGTRNEYSECECRRTAEIRPPRGNHPTGDASSKVTPPDSPLAAGVAEAPNTPRQPKAPGAFPRPAHPNHSGQPSPTGAVSPHRR